MDYFSSVNQNIIEQFVNIHINCNVTSLATPLLVAAINDEDYDNPFHYENLENYSWENEDGDYEEAEVFQWFAVSPWLYEKLQEQEEVVTDAGSCYVWGRQTCGQSTTLDAVIGRICKSIGILEGQEHSWAKK
jgi:hypothetical protein